MLALYVARVRTLTPPLLWLYPVAISILIGFGIWYWKMPPADE